MSEGDDRVRLNELQAMVETFLPDASEEEVQRIGSLQLELREQQMRLAMLLEAGVIREPEYARAVNRELAWCLRRCSAMLGDERCERLFGSPAGASAGLIDESFVAVDQRSQSAEAVLPRAAEIASRYVPLQREQKHLIAAMRRIDPQRLEAISELSWAAGRKYASLITSIAEAELAYRRGDVWRSIDCAFGVAGGVAEYRTVSDTPLYLVSWAYHIQGRAHEALREWRSAVAHYDASLTLKLQMGHWLSPLLLMATEIKLGSVELVFQSPAEAATRLSRVSEVLQASRKLQRTNPRLFENLVVDSGASLAEAHLELGNRDQAAEHARRALRSARRLGDRVGELRLWYVLLRAAHLQLSTLRDRIKEAFHQDPELSAHPRVAYILHAIEGMSVVDDR